MNCTECQDKFTEILDDDTPSNMATAFKAHLASCATCATDFKGFKKTVETLHSMPQHDVPPDFLIGINEKLDITTLGRLKQWFSFMGQHKLTASATMATLIVGVISATILQTTPELGPKQLNQNHTTYTQAITTQTESKSHSNYYPGVPYLTGKKQPERTISPVVQFASTIPRGSQDYYNVQGSRGSPQHYEQTTYINFNNPIINRSTNPKPDFHIIIHPASTFQQRAISHRIAANSNWTTHSRRSTLFVTLTDKQLPEFQRLFPPPAPPHKKLDFSPLENKRNQNLFTIAISFK